MNAVNDALMSYKKYLLDFRKLGTFQTRKDPLTLKKFINHYSLHKYEKIHGIYLFCEHGSSPWIDDNVVVYYVGQTKKSVVNRVCSHFKAFVELDSKNEATGRSFLKAGIDINQKFDVYFIESEVLGIFDDETSIMSEKAFQTIFNVIVRDSKYKK